MTKISRVFTLLPLTTLAWATVASAMLIEPQTTAPVIKASVQSEAIDLTRYYPSCSAASVELDTLESDADAFTKKAPTSDIGAYLEEADGLIGRARRLNVYFTILAARDIDDKTATTAKQRADTLQDTIDRKADTVLRALPASSLPNAAGRLQRYRYLATRMADEARHILPTVVSNALDATAGSASTAYWTIYQKTQRLPVAAPIKTLAKASASLGDERSTREAEWRGRWLTANAKADVNAAILLAIVNQGEKVAKLENYPDAASMGYAGRGLDRAMVDRSLASVQSHLALYQAYNHFRATRLKAIANIADPRPWDMSLLRNGPTPHFSFDDARRIVPTALAPLGTDYVRHFTDLLTPGAGRIDVAARTGNRESGGFSVNAPGVPSGLYMASFDGSINDLRVVAHEGGHAVAAQFANEGGTSSFFAIGPNWMMESYAIFNELILFDYLVRTSTTKADRAYYKGLLIDDMMFQVFGSAEEATLEQSIYDGVAAGKIQSAADLNGATFRVMKGFEPWPDDILHTSSTLWSTKRLLFQDPFYLVNYMYAGMIAINLYKEAKVHPETFPARYKTLLRRGYDAPPMALLAPVLGKEVSGEELATNAFGVMQDELQKLSADDTK